MKKELLETIDETIIMTCKWINKMINDENGQLLYPSNSIKALAELISARTLLQEKNQFFSDSSNA